MNAKSARVLTLDEFAKRQGLVKRKHINRFIGRGTDKKIYAGSSKMFDVKLMKEVCSDQDIDIKLIKLGALKLSSFQRMSSKQPDKYKINKAEIVITVSHRWLDENQWDDGKLVDSIIGNCDFIQVDPNKVGVFIDWYCLPQKIVDDENKNFKYRTLDYEELFQKWLVNMKYIYSMSDYLFVYYNDEEKYLSSSWCMFEYMISKYTSKTIINPKGKDLTGTLDTEMMMSIMSKTRATNKSDESEIMSQMVAVLNLDFGFDSLDRKVIPLTHEENHSGRFTINRLNGFVSYSRVPELNFDQKEIQYITNKLQQSLVNPCCLMPFIKSCRYNLNVEMVGRELKSYVLVYTRDEVSIDIMIMRDHYHRVHYSVRPSEIHDDQTSFIREEYGDFNSFLDDCESGYIHPGVLISLMRTNAIDLQVSKLVVDYENNDLEYVYDV